MKVCDQITIAIPVLNEEKNLPICLGALEQFSNIIVIDSGSTDKTRQICKEYGIPVVNFDWNGSFPKKRNWFLDSHEIHTDWILFLDADEMLTPEFISELCSNFEPDKFDGYWLTYTNYFLGKAMRFGFQQKKLALFSTKYRYERIESEAVSSYDMEIHEHPTGLKTVGKLNAPILHNDYKGLVKFIERHLVYASWECERVNSIKDESLLTFRQRVKYKLLKTSLFPFIYFILDYVILLRFLDGVVGLKYSFYKAWYFSVIRALVNEK
jgi:glycosyltransferase involved in cell wall biosynthesis